MTLNQSSAEPYAYKKLLLYIPIIFIYISYLLFISLNNHPPVDYQTFMQIGQRYLNHQPIWEFGSYYPLPYVMIFAWFSTLPAPLSIFLWHIIPLIAILVISRGRLWPLLLGIVIDHFIGGQSVVFVLIGITIYRNHQKDWWGGVGLALLLMKPNLAIFPLAWAGIQWLQELRVNRRISSQVWAFIGVAILMFLPSFLVMPDWLSTWTPTRRPIDLRPLAGILPRSLVILNNHNAVGTGSEFWIPLVVIAIVLFIAIWFANRRKLSFDIFMLFSFIVSPYVHDYDLLQIIPFLDTSWKRKLAIVTSLPTWFVIFTAYDNNSAWFVVTITVPILLAAILYRSHQPDEAALLPPAPTKLEVAQS